MVFMLENNLKFIKGLFDDDAPIEQIISALITTIITLEEMLEDGSAFFQNKAIFYAGIEGIVTGLQSLEKVLPELKLEGNRQIILKSTESQKPPEGILYFLGRTLDAIRAPVESSSLNSEQTRDARSAVVEMYRGTVKFYNALS